MTIQYSVSKVADCFDEVIKLLDDHYKELSVTKGFALNPDYEIYKHNDKTGNVRVILCKDDGTIVGYIIYFLSANLHYRDCLLATEDIYYLKPAYRKGTIGIKMFKFAENYLKTLGVHMVKYSTKVHMDNSRLFEYLGCDFIEKVFVKNLR